MPDPATDPAWRRTPKALAGLAGVACLACCLLPTLIAAGVVGAGASAVVGWLPGAALALAVLAGATWWWGHRRGPCACADETTGQGGCGCQSAPEAREITIGAPR
jgi:mercuric ion transport protein